MGRGGAAYLSYTALLLLSPNAHAADSELCAFCNLWRISIDLSPAPSPQDGPPFSAHADRNPDSLPYEVIGILGAYIATVLVLGLLMLTVGRSLRKRAQAMTVRPQEMVKPAMQQFDTTPLSPKSERSWYARHVKGQKSIASSIRSAGGSFHVGSPGGESVASFDPGVIEADRARRQEEMERLYAAVMAHDDHKQAGASVEAIVQPPSYEQRRPPPLVTDAPHLKHLQPLKSPGAPKSPVRAIYPPGSRMYAGSQSPTSPLKGEYSAYAFGPAADNDLKEYRSRATSFGSQRGASEPERSGGNKLRKGLRNLKISAPIVNDDNSDGARTPLSPRFYPDPGVPPEPPTTNSTHVPTTPGSTRSYGYDVDAARDIPAARLTRAGAYEANNEAQALTDVASTRPDAATQQRRQQPPKPTLTINSRPLPLRQLTAQQQAAYTAAHPLSPLTQHINQPFSAGPGQTQFVSPRRDGFGGPRTGMATPYSPYMPFTPLMPVTPRLMTRAQRKQRQKDERRVQGAITEEDAVADEKDLWSSGY